MLPPTRVRELLEASRRAGVPWEAAWPAALAEVEEDVWREVLSSTTAAWQRAYLLEAPTRGDLAFDILGRDDAGELLRLDAPHRCRECDAVIVYAGPGRRDYCDDRCRRLAAYRREPAKVAA